MDGELERQSGEETLATARKSVEVAQRRLEDEQREAARREWGGWLIKLREKPLLRGPMKRLATLFLGVPLSASAGEMPEQRVQEPRVMDAAIPYEAQDSSEESDEQRATQTELIQLLHAAHQEKRTDIQAMAGLEAQYPETDRFYLWELAQVAKTIENHEAAPEYYARVGLPEWTPYQRSLFADAPVSERFTELHPEYRNLSNQEFLRLYPEMLDKAMYEFRFSNQFRFLTDDAITLFVAEIETMDPRLAVEQYKTLAKVIGNKVGLTKVIELTDRLIETVGADHPLTAYVRELGINEARTLVGRSKKNIVHMDQLRGQLRILRKVNGDTVLIDTFPAIGGPLNSPEMNLTGKPTGSEFIHVPDVTMSVSSVDRAKTSWSWHNSWVPQGAPIRESGDELQYQHPGNRQWYDLTGPNAAFFPHKGGELKPFDGIVEPMDVGLIRAATHRDPSSDLVYVPVAWTKAGLLERNGGEVPTEWKWNDFGSMAMRLSVDGAPTNINIHSKPNEDTQDFLPGRTHGCFATYGEYVKQMADTYGVGSGTTVVVTTKAGREETLLAQK